MLHMGVGGPMKLRCKILSVLVILVAVGVLSLAAAPAMQNE
jgi:hypothetical protein